MRTQCCEVESCFVIVILNKPDDLKTDEGFQQYHEAAVEILEILHDYLPKLLRNEVFFNNVFYKQNKR